MDSVFFDLVGTLIHGRGSIGTQYAVVAGRFGIDADPAALDGVFRAVLARHPTFAIPGPAVPDLPAAEKRAWRVIVEAVFAESGYGAALRSRSFGEYFDALFTHFATGDAWALYPDAIPALEALGRAGRRVGLISNFDSRVFPLLDRLGIASAFASVTIPALAGAAKPEPAIFRHALASHAIPAARAVYVGNSISEDIVAARGAGMAAILIDRRGCEPKPEGTIAIESLDGLERVVEGIRGGSV